MTEPTNLPPAYWLQQCRAEIEAAKKRRAESDRDSDEQEAGE